MRRLLLLLLGVTAFCLCVFATADTQRNRQADKSSLPEKDGVLQLKKGNFNKALRKYKQLLVHFYAPLSGEGQRVSAAFEGAAAKLQESKVKLGVVDVSQEKDLAKSLDATVPPTIRLYLDGDKQNPVPCPVPQSSASILTWLKRRAGPAADLITDLSQSEASEELMVVGFFKELDQDYAQTASQILNSPVLNHALLFINKSSEDFNEIHADFSGAAEKFRMKILFVWVNVAEPRNGRLMEYFRVRDFEAPLIRMVNLTDHVTYHLPSDTLNVASIVKFCQTYLDGKAKPKMQSEPIPEGWDQKPVKELVGMTLEKVAFNPDKTVFVLFYLPYSKASRAVFPLWEELAEALKEREDVVVARIDASANDINMSMQGTYPSLCLFPALHAERVVVYTGKRTLKDLVKFLDKEMAKAKKDRDKAGGGGRRRRRSTQLSHRLLSFSQRASGGRNLGGMEPAGAYGAGKAGSLAFDPVAFFTHPRTVLRLLSWVFSIVVFSCIVNEGYINIGSERLLCVFNNNADACNYGITIGVACFLASICFMILDVYFPSISSVRDRRRAVLLDLIFSGLASFLWLLASVFWPISGRRPLQMSCHWLRAQMLLEPPSLSASSPSSPGLY
ncbi:hypothetical protein INR49_032829 [Caranx melampygus]|nr:hypothetical protein INR49_032829 [Caranx melampygus]